MKPVPMLHSEVRELILTGRQQVAQAVNMGLTLTYWRIGARIHRDVLKHKRAAYGREIIQTLAGKLVAEFGAGFGRRNLFNMVKFTELFPDLKIVQTLSAQLGWSHFTLLLRVGDPLAREFYAEMGRHERWNVRTLQEKINSQLYLRTALSRKPEATARAELATLRDENRLSPDLVFRDPYVLDFLQLKDSYAERDLEAAILHDIEAFLLELGEGFTFVTRQKRMMVDGVDHYLDLLFYHRRLHRLFAVELKLGAFKPADKGQMELYLAWLRENERADGEQNPVGLILCADRNEETVRLLGLNEGPVRVASYLADVLPRKELARKLRDAVHRARARLTKALPGSGAASS